jgi:hypothetical protein
LTKIPPEGRADLAPPSSLAGFGRAERATISYTGLRLVASTFFLCYFVAENLLLPA